MAFYELLGNTYNTAVSNIYAYEQEQKRAEALAEIDADRDKTSSVIFNLISNAIKYSPNGNDVNIYINSKDKEAIIGVRDNGMGIKPEDQQKLFDRYYRVENSQMRNIGGFGIGLYLSAEIIKRHNGNIWVESEFGKGAEFLFTLPIN